MNYKEFPEKIMSNLTFVDSMAKAQAILDMTILSNDKWRVAYSGGSDSDTMMWFLRHLGYEPHAVFYDTGLEYDAAHRHVEYMRSEGFIIDKIKAAVPIPTAQVKYGSPFISKRVSEMLERLQRHKFNFQEYGNLSFDVLWKMYPNAKSALQWWTNTHVSTRNNISWNKYLKEFLIKYSLPFKVSGKCCDGAKKRPVKKYAKNNSIDLFIMGIRRVEMGARFTAYKNCFVEAKKYKYSMYFPLFWWGDNDKRLFDDLMNIKHSDAYSVYGLLRTGCAGCPFGRKFKDELDVAQKYEPKLYKGINNIFANSYEWTRKYRNFIKEQKEK